MLTYNSQEIMPQMFETDAPELLVAVGVKVMCFEAPGPEDIDLVF